MENEEKKLPECPECEKQLKISDDSQKLGEFLEWLQSNNYEICKWQDGITDATKIADAFAIANGGEDPDPDEERPEQGYFPIRMPIEKILAVYFKIDLKKVEEERRALLQSLRE